MSNIFNTLKSKVGGNKSNEDEQQFSIQPHPAKTNDPADLQRDQLGGGLNSQHEPAGAFHARGPYQPPSHITNNMEQPASRDELRARQAELNK